MDARATPSATVEPMPAFTHRQIMRVLSGILLCMLLAALDQTAVVPAVPAIAADLNGFGHLAWIVSAYLLTSTTATPIYGKLSDIHGRRALLLPAIVLFVIASALCGVAQSLPQLIAARALQGLGGAGLMSMAQSAIADVIAPRERGKYQAYMSGVWGVASIAGPIVGGWMTDHLSWRWIFWINLPIGLVAFVLSSRALKLLKVRRQQTRIDYVGAAMLTGLITGCLLIMSWGGVAYAWLSAPIVALGGVVVVLLLLLVRQERRSGEPLLPPRLFGNGVFSLGVLVAFLISACMFGCTFLLPLFFQLIRGVGAAASGTLIVPLLGANVAGAYLAGQLARRQGRVKSILLGGLVLAVIGFALLATMGPGTNHAVSVLLMAADGFGIGICMPSTLLVVQNAAERRDVGVATATLIFLRSMGGAFGSTLVGALLASRFAARLVALGIHHAIDLGALRGHQGGATGLDTATQAIAQVALTSGFHLAFLVCAALAALGVIACLGMRDLPLRSGASG
jgi:EmrB/QacA subfamily drug resistance transporter